MFMFAAAMTATLRKSTIGSLVCWGLSLFVVLSATAAEPQPRGLGDPGQLVELTVNESEPPQAAKSDDATPANAKPRSLVLRGPDATAQLLVTGRFDSQQVRDLTRSVEYQVSPADVVEVSATGGLLPLGEGNAIVRIVRGELSTAIDVEVTDLGEPAPVNFRNQVVPVFTKLGCNAGGCHGKAEGQNGFRLSLLGFYPAEDHEHLVKESRGRRLFPAAPERSLLLQKATGQVPHSGGARLSVDSPAYEVIRRWIAEGATLPGEDAPTIERLEVDPPRRELDLGAQQQLRVTAHYSDGSTRDVTELAQFESADKNLATVNETGLVRSTNLPGSVGVMARFQSQVAVFRALMPLGAPVNELPEPNNFVDELVFAQLVRLGLPPSRVCGDAEFLRRVTIDIAGRLPTRKEIDDFMADTNRAKRRETIDRLLASADYADYFANKWSALLRNRSDENSSGRPTYALHAWVRQSLWENKPYDRFVGELLTASGTAGREPTVTWYHQLQQPSDLVEDTAQVFLGQRIQCARCHHHPFEKWSQDDYHSLAAYFSRLGRKTSRIEPGKQNIFHQPGQAGAVNPKTRQFLKPRGLGAGPRDIATDQDPRQALADWMSEPENPFFAAALANRYWKHFLGRGLVEPEDDMRVTNPPSNPELLEALAEHFRASQFDLKQLVRTICNSKTYQLSAVPNEHNANDTQNFSRFYPRRLHAEVLSDAIDAVTETSTTFKGTLVGTRAVQLPDFDSGSYLLTVFGRPEGNSACECERTGDATLAQSLHLLNSAEILKKVSTGRTARLAADQRPHGERIRELYLIAFSREPTEREIEAAVDYIDSKEGETQAAYEDLVTVLINTKEFLFNH